MGNKILLKTDSKVAAMLEEFCRLLLACGAPPEDFNLVHTDRQNMEDLLINCNLRNTMFTGSSRAAEHLMKVLKGKVKIEDAGFDWKVLGPDVGNVEHIASVCDQDAYALSGQKCSAQSIMFMHENYGKTDLLARLKTKAETRTLANRLISPVLSWNNTQLSEHVSKVLKVPGAQMLFGGEPVKEKHSIPSCYGSFLPTAIKVPMEAFFEHSELLLKEVFAPFQIVAEYKSNQVDCVIALLEAIDHHLTAAVVSNDVEFINKMVSNTVNGTTYVGLRARTTGAPQNHWFGPSNDPRGAGIGTSEAIRYVWSHHREVIYDTHSAEGVKVTQS